MKGLTLSVIAKAVNGVYHGPKEKLDKEIAGACFDSRKLVKDGLFFATKGERTNGHKFLPQVYENGALCCVVERELEEQDLPEGMKLEQVSYIVVPDSFIAIRRLAMYYRKSLDVKVVGVTGSVGKTSTKELIAAVLSAKFRVFKTEANHNNILGLSMMIFELRPEHEVAVLEMGISDFGEMALLASVARPDIGVITNIGQCHLENLGDRDGILLAKTEFFGYLPKDGRVVLNGGDDKLAAISQVAGQAPVFFNDEKTCFADKVVSRGLLGTECVIHTPEFDVNADIPVPGAHQILNAMAAVRVGQLLGMTKEQIEEGIRNTETIKGRGKVMETPLFTLIDDAYNANPVSMMAGLRLLSEADTRTVAILGDMFELGTDERALHRGVGEGMKEEGIAPDVLICIGDLAGEIYEGAEGVCERYHYPDKESFLDEGIGHLAKGDTILLKASHGMAFDALVKALEGKTSLE
jgi:UDP-N-acetylmuramoyl-tripeptide--D-alanyl-D-alanine ligase